VLRLENGLPLAVSALPLGDSIDVSSFPLDLFA